MSITISAVTSCGEGPKGEAPWIVDRFDDIKVIRYEVPGFETLPLEQKELVYYLSRQRVRPRHPFRSELRGEPAGASDP